MKLGPIQELWLSQLEKHPERQCKNILGMGNSKNYKACCLGEGVLCIYRYSKKNLPFIKGRIKSGNSTSTLSSIDTRNLGLFNAAGRVCHKDSSAWKNKYSCLAKMNDSGISWPKIAKYIRKNPEKVFKESK